MNLMNNKGNHMSRLVKILVVTYGGLPIGADDSLLWELADGHGVGNAYWECKWESIHIDR